MLKLEMAQKSPDSSYQVAFFLPLLRVGGEGKGIETNEIFQ